MPRFKLAHFPTLRRLPLARVNDAACALIESRATINDGGEGGPDTCATYLTLGVTFDESRCLSSVSLQRVAGCVGALESSCQS